MIDGSVHPKFDPSFWRGRNVLVTGHTGFKGSWLAHWLLDLGAHVFGIALEPEDDVNLFTLLDLNNRLESHTLDINSRQHVKELITRLKPDFLFHLAAQPLVRSSYIDPCSTWETNVLGTINVLESLRLLENPCCAVMVTTDKVYQNKEHVYGYRESDPLGGHDPYSSSKAAAEIAIHSWRSSFCGTLSYQTPYLRIASARAGNVIGGGDWAPDRIIPDAIRSLSNNIDIRIRNPYSTRPWQHVLEPLRGYLCLAQAMYQSNSYCKPYNFGPFHESTRTVQELIDQVLVYWPGHSIQQPDIQGGHEAGLLNLSIELAHHELGWSPSWDFSTTVKRTVDWYRRVHYGEASALDCCRDDLSYYYESLKL